MLTEQKRQSVGGTLSNRIPIALVLAQMTQAAGLPISAMWEMSATEWMFAVAQRIGKTREGTAVG